MQLPSQLARCSPLLSFPRQPLTQHTASNTAWLSSETGLAPEVCRAACPREQPRVPVASSEAHVGNSTVTAAERMSLLGLVSGFVSCAVMTCSGALPPLAVNVKALRAQSVVRTTTGHSLIDVATSRLSDDGGARMLQACVATVLTICCRPAVQLWLRTQGPWARPVCRPAAARQRRLARACPQTQQRAAAQP